MLETCKYDFFGQIFYKKLANGYFSGEAGLEEFDRAYFFMKQVPLPDSPPPTPTDCYQSELPSNGYITIIP
jgi:hypothetical protein